MMATIRNYGKLSPPTRQVEGGRRLLLNPGVEQHWRTPQVAVQIFQKRGPPAHAKTKYPHNCQAQRSLWEGNKGHHSTASRSNVTLATRPELKQSAQPRFRWADASNHKLPAPYRFRGQKRRNDLRIPRILAIFQKGESERELKSAWTASPGSVEDASSLVLLGWMVCVAG